VDQQTHCSLVYLLKGYRAWIIKILVVIRNDTFKMLLGDVQHNDH